MIGEVPRSPHQIEFGLGDVRRPTKSISSWELSVQETNAKLDCVTVVYANDT